MPQESLNLPYLLLIGIVLMTLIVSFAMYKPQVETLQKVRADVVQVTSRLQERQEFLDGIDKKSAQLRTHASTEQELNVLLPTDESFDDVLRIVDRQGAAAAVAIKGVDNTTSDTQSARRVAQALGTSKEAPDNLTVHGVNIGVQGSYQQIRQFLSLMENSIRFMDITKLSVSSSKEVSDVLDASISANFYSLSPAK